VSTGFQQSRVSLGARLRELRAGVTGRDLSARPGIVPSGAAVAIPPANGFRLYDERPAIVEDRRAELWLDGAESVALAAQNSRDLHRTSWLQ
jgi:hypothetical protein